MRTRIFDGEVYIKASELARQCHYTSDYLGQLARQEKVQARLAGRSWYIDEASLLEYRKRDVVRPQLPVQTKVPVKAAIATKPRKIAPVAKRQASKKRIVKTDSTAATAPKLRRTPSKKRARTSPSVVQTVVPSVTPTREPNEKPGLWQKASGWLKRLKR